MVFVLGLLRKKRIRSSFLFYQNVDGAITNNGMDNNKHFLHLSHLFNYKTNLWSNKDYPKCVSVNLCFAGFQDKDDQIL